jgi:hypothetical protein
MTFAITYAALLIFALMVNYILHGPIDKQSDSEYNDQSNQGE